MQNKQKSSYPLRLEDDTRARAEEVARSNHRSLNVELGLLIEDGMRWRAEQRESRTNA